MVNLSSLDCCRITYDNDDLYVDVPDEIYPEDILLIGYKNLKKWSYQYGNFNRIHLMRGKDPRITIDLVESTKIPVFRSRFLSQTLYKNFHPAFLFQFFPEKIISANSSIKRIGYQPNDLSGEYLSFFLELDDKKKFKKELYQEKKLENYPLICKYCEWVIDGYIGLHNNEVCGLIVIRDQKLPATAAQ